MNEPITIPGQDDWPAVETPPVTPPFSQSWVGRAWLYLTKSRRGRYQTGFLALLLTALGLRLWELSGRVMHYDEAIHLYYSWQLSNFEDYFHSPWMHGPFQIELVALFLKLLGDTDFTARLAYALLGTALVALPYFLREHLGRAGTLLTGVLLTISPSLLYFSRFGRNDIIMAFLATSLFILMWRYIHQSKNRYLYLAAAVLAIAFATKETAYIITLIFGALAFLMALPYAAFRPARGESSAPAGELSGPTPRSMNPTLSRLKAAPAWGVRTLRRLNPARLTGPGGFLVLLITLTLPQWSAGVELAQKGLFYAVGVLFGEDTATRAEESLGLTLVNRDGVTNGIVGAPHWDAPFVQLPLFDAPVLMHGLVLLLFIGVCLAIAWKYSGSWQRWLAGAGIPVAMVGASALAVLRPLGGTPDLLMAGGISLTCLAAFIYLRYPWRKSLPLLLAPFLITVFYTVLFLPVVKVDALLLKALPDGIQVASSGNAVPLNFIVAAGVLTFTGLVSLALGLHWKGGVWLVCAAIFYLIWVTLYTTIFTNFAGIFSGVWQGMGYWIAQQDVARGNQPWYYYFVGLSVYEFLPVIFGLIGAVVFVKRRDRLGMALAFWAGVNFLAYTVASEKMPWLLVNITLPFIFLAGKLLGELVEQVPWQRITEKGQLLSLVAPPLTLAGVLYVALSYVNTETSLTLTRIGVLVGTALLAVSSAWLARRAGSEPGLALAGLGIAGLLLGFTAWTAFQAAYTYDDSKREILVYAQGSANLLETHQELSNNLFADADSSVLSSPVQVDYDLWYPFQWYVRHEQEAGLLHFTCFRDEKGEGGCSAVEGDVEAAGLLLAAHHRATGAGKLPDYRQTGPRRNLLWFPETYRRPGENRQTEEFQEEFTKDLAFFRDAASERKYWHEALNYLLYRRLDSDWFTSEYYTYLPRDSAGFNSGVHQAK